MSAEMIPHTIEEREDTGLFNAKLGIWLFLASEIMLFGSLFSSYILLRMGAPNWPHGSDLLNVPLAFCNTLVLISSSVTIILSWVSLKQGDTKKYRIFMALTLLCALFFLVAKTIEYSAKFSHDIYPATSTFYAIYFTLTGLHGLHVFGGVILLSYFLFPGLKLYHKQPQRFINRIEVAGLYWHFVDLVWIFLFPVLYLL